MIHSPDVRKDVRLAFLYVGEGHFGNLTAEVIL